MSPIFLSPNNLIKGSHTFCTYNIGKKHHGGNLCVVLLCEGNTKILYCHMQKIPCPCNMGIYVSEYFYLQQFFLCVIICLNQFSPEMTVELEGHIQRSHKSCVQYIPRKKPTCEQHAFGSGIMDSKNMFPQKILPKFQDFGFLGSHDIFFSPLLAICDSDQSWK